MWTYSFKMDFLQFAILLVTAHLLILTVFAAPATPPKPEALPRPLARQSAATRAPVLTEEPSSVLVENSHATVRLECRANGFPPPVITWLKDGLPLNDVSVRDLVQLPVGTLIFIQIRSKGDAQNTGTYQCIATNNVGTIASRNASVQVATIKDEFRQTPVDTWARLGGSTTLECQPPKGIPEPEVTWKKNNQNVKPNSRVQIRPGGNLVINRLMKTDSGTYSCVATNVAGTVVSNEAELRVQKPPSFTIRPSNEKVLVGESVELHCAAVGDPLPRIRWSRTRGSTADRHVTLSNGNLRINDIQAADEGEYICTAENRVGIDTATAFLSVQAPPEIIDVAPDTTVQIGETISLPCKASGLPPPTVFWRNVQGTEMFIGRSYKEGHMIITLDGTLTIYSVQYEDRGMYECQALNPLGSVTAEVQLSVQKRNTVVPPPVISTVPLNVTTTLDETATFQCASSSTPKPDIRWYKNEYPLKSDTRISKMSAGSLKIKNIQRSDAGRYTCEASNDNGVAKWDAWLTISEDGNVVTSPASYLAPPAPSKPEMIDSASDYITLTWESNISSGSSPILYYVVEYFKIGSSARGWHREERVSRTVLNVRHLTASSDYIFVVRSASENGISEPSPISKSMRTADQIVANPPLTTDTTSAELNAVTVNLVEAVPLLTSGSGTGSVRLRWETTSGCDVIGGFMVVAQPVSVPYGELVTQATTCKSRIFTLHNIISNAKYEVRIRPYKGKMTGKASPIVFMSLQNGIVQAASPILSTKVDPDDWSKVKFHWQPPRDIPAVYVTGYALRCRSRDDSSYDRTVHVNSSSTDLVLTGLREDKTYVTTVTYSTKLGDGMSSNEQEFALEAYAGDTEESDGFAEMIQRQPAVIAGLAAGIIIVLAIIVGGVCYYKRCRRSRKARGLHASHRSTGRDRFNTSIPYSSGFHITPTTGGQGMHGHNTGQDDFGHTGHGGDNNGNNNYFSSGTNTNGAPNTIMTYNAKNDVVGGCLDEKPISLNHPSQNGFSYVSDQLTSATSIPPQFSTTNLSRPSIASSHSSSVQQLTQQRNINGIGMEGENQSNFFVAPNSNAYILTDLPPPPPSPPLSQRTGFSDRSRGSSGLHSAGDPSVRSGQKSRRSARSNRPPNAMNASGVGYFSSDRNQGIDGTQHASSLSRNEAAMGNISPTPPTPPVRGVPNFSYGHPVMHFENARDPTLNLGYLAGPSEEDSDNDRVGQLRVRTFSPEHDPRSSMAVSAVSMLNTYDPESDERDSYGDRDSTASLSSDDESFHMESVSQVGQHLLRDDEPKLNFQNRQYQHSVDRSPQRQYLAPHRNQPREDEPLVKDGAKYSTTTDKSKLSRKQGSKTRRANKTSNNSLTRINSGGSSSSSYHHNTGDSGMSAGVGCSTDHNSLKSSASGGSSGSRSTGSKMNRSRTAENIASNINKFTGPIEPSVPRLDIVSTLADLKMNVDNGPSSPTASGVSEQSGYLSTASSCWQFQPPSSSLSKQLQMNPRRVPHPSTGGRKSSRSPQRPNNLPDTTKVPFVNGNVSAKSPQKQSNNSNNVTICSASDQTSNALNGGQTQFQAARAAFASGKLDRGRRQELPDVPEVLTSDFCEDYSDQSQ